MSPDATGRRRREIEPEDFQRLLARLDPDPERASRAYEQLRRELVKFFCRDRVRFDAEELADRVLDEVAKKPDDYEIRNVGDFAIGVARFLRLESFRKNSTTQHIETGENFPDREANPEQTILRGIDQERKLACFLQCMQRLKPEERWLVLEYYPAENRNLEERRKNLTKVLGIDAGALTSRMNRLRVKLVQCCKNCYARGSKNQVSADVEDRG